jgi:serine protease Do
VRRAGRPAGLTFALALVLGGIAAGVPGGWLGVRIRDLSETEMDELSARHGIREGYGVMVVAVLDGSPAARSSVRSGDVIVGFEGRPIVDSRSLQRIVAGAPLDREVPLTVLRRDGRQRLLVRLQPMPPEIAGERVAAEFGFFMREGSAEEAGSRGGEPAVESLALITDVMPGSAAERGGLMAGDVLRLINAQLLGSFRDATLILSRLPVDQPLRLVVRRGDNDQLALTLPEASRP